MLSIFSCDYWPSVCLLWRNVCLGVLSSFQLGSFRGVILFCFVLLLLLNCMNCLHILEIKTLLVASFANTFFQSIDYLFVLFMVSFTVKKLRSLIRSHLFIFAFISIALRDWSKRTLVQFMSENILPMLSSWSFSDISYI